MIIHVLDPGGAITEARTVGHGVEDGRWGMYNGCPSQSLFDPEYLQQSFLI